MLIKKEHPPVFLVEHSTVNLIDDPICLSLYVYYCKSSHFNLDEFAKKLNISKAKVKKALCKLIDLNIVKLDS